MQLSRSPISGFLFACLLLLSVVVIPCTRADESVHVVLESELDTLSAETNAFVTDVQCADLSSSCSTCLDNDACCYISSSHSCVNISTSSECSALDEDECFCPHSCHYSTNASISHGSCSTSERRCICNPGWDGDACDVLSSSSGDLDDKTKKKDLSIVGIIAGVAAAVGAVVISLVVYKMVKKSSKAKQIRLAHTDDDEFRNDFL